MPGLTVTTGTPAEDTIAVTGTAPQILTDLDVAVNIPHTFLADVEITITSPAGTSVLILADQCGGSDDINVLFDDDAAPIACASPTLGSFAPLNPLSVFNGESFDGDWIITVVDDAGGDDGSLVTWCLIPTLGDPAIEGCTDPLACNFDPEATVSTDTCTFPVSCDDSDACTTDGIDQCDPADCVNTPITCDDGDACNGLETCDADLGCVAGTPLDCDDGDACNGLETCDADLGCVAGTPLDCDDGDACNGLETCDADLGCVAGTPLDCDDGDACNGLETCDADLGCVAGTPLDCDDGDACNGLETCDADLGCVAGTPLDCDDGDACNGLETCDADLGCVAGTPLDCDDGDACNGLETCDADLGCVAGTPLDCDDGDACNGLETCDADLGCVAGTPLDCDDGDACNGLETCDADLGCVAGTPLDCDDGDACNGLETCDADLGCVAGTPLDCDDGDACNGLETCDADLGCVAGTPLDCDDGDACNGLETCDADLGCVAGTPLNCDDNDATTNDSCDPVLGCINTPIACDDDDACTTDVLNPTSGLCEYTAVNCDDGDACNGLETCDADLGCVAGTPLDCDDGDACNGLETCDADLGCVAGTPLDCDDGDACNGLETCDADLGCVAGTPLDCDDGDACNGLETCDADLGCVAGTPLVCDDGNECTTDSCDPATGCVFTDIVCDDGDPNTTDACVDGVCIYTPPNPTDDCGLYTSMPGLTVTTGTPAEDTIAVTGTAPQILTDLDVAVNIPHTFLADVEITITSPAGTSALILADQCGGSDDIIVLFDDDAAPIACASPTLGSYAPLNPLSVFNGESFDGDWIITVVDDAAGDDGSLVTWCLIPTLEDPPTEGCTDALACNYNDDPTITENNTLCIYPTGCDTCSGLTNGNGVVVDNPEIGDACDDGDTFTENDVLTACDVCEGTPIPLPTDDCGLYTSMPGLTVTTGTPAEDTIAVTGTAPQILTDLDVAVNIPHTFLADVEITITSPAGTSVLILADQCGGSDDIIVLFDDDAAPIACASPTLGSYAPLNPLSVFNGESFDGDWIITVVDDAAGDDGSLVTWCLIPTLEDPPTEGCTDALACNYNDDPTITENNTLCIYPTGCDTCSGLTNGNGVVVDNPEIGDACDDGDTFTENDVLTACDVCEGTPIPLPTDDCGLYTSMPGLTVTTGTPAEDTIAVTGTAPQILTDLDVAVNIPHTFLADVEITITSPAGTSVLILADQCGGSDDINVLFDDDAAPIACASPTLGSYAPLNPLSVFNGESFDGDWIITVVDDAGGDDGSLVTWCLIPTLGDPAIEGCTDPLACNFDPEATVSTDTCTFPVSCDDSDACTTDGIDQCDPADCTNVVIDCDDGDPTTADSCDPLIGCINTPIACDDNDACTMDVLNEKSGLCVYTAINCDDGDDCTIDSCDPAIGCVNTVVVCDDGDVCNGLETCDGMGGCNPGSLLDCNDGDLCTLDSCDPVIGCINTPIDCNDGDPSTTDTCEDGVCINTPAGPANDLCADALPIECDETVTGTTVGATSESLDFCGTSLASSPGVWYTFVGNGDNVEFSTCNQADFDTKIGVFSGACDLLECEGGNDDNSGAGCTGNTSLLQVSTIVGTNYYIYVTGFGTAEGNFALTATCTTPPPVPSNDLCADAEPIGCGETATGNTEAASNDDTLETCGTSVNSAPGVWYSITGTGQAITVDLFGSTFDTKLAIYSGACDALVCVGGNDDTGGVQSEVTFWGATGTTYYAYVTGFSSNAGEYTINVTCNDVVCDDLDACTTDVLDPATGDCSNTAIDCDDGDACTMDSCDEGICVNTPMDCDDGDACTTDSCDEGVCVNTPIDCNDGDPTTTDTCVDGICVNTPIAPGNDLCDDATPIECDATSTGSTATATVGADLEGCTTGVNSAPGVWYTFVGTGNSIIINTNGSAFDTKLGVYSGTCDALVCIDSDDDGGTGTQSMVTFASEAGVTYYAYVTGFGTASGDYVINVICPLPPENDSICDAPEIEPVACNNTPTVTGTNTGATDDGIGLSCGGTGVIENVWYSVVVPAGGSLNIETHDNGGLNDTQLGAFTSDNNTCNGVLTEIACDDDGGLGLKSKLELTGLTPGQVIFFQVDGFGAADGSFDLSVSYGEPLVNDEPAGALAISADNYWGVPGWDTFDIAGASESMPACDGGDAGDDSWYSFVAQSENQGILARANPSNPDAANVDMVIQVFESDMTPLAGMTGDVCSVDRSCFNNAGPGQIERAVPTGLTIGNTYIYRVYDAAVNPANCENSLLIDTKVKTYVPHDIVAGCVEEVINTSHTWTIENPAMMYNIPPVPVQQVRMVMKDLLGNVVSMTPSQSPSIPGGLNFTLADFSPVVPNGDYEVCAQHLIKMQANGCIEAYWSQSGPSCPTSINLFGGVVTTLNEANCGISGVDLNAVITANPILGVDFYQFNFTNASFPDNNFSFEHTSNSLLLGAASVIDNGVLQGLYYGQTYNVTVQGYMNGAYEPEGPVCTVTLSDTPPTPVIVNGCGTNVLTATKNTGPGMSYDWGFFAAGNVPPQSGPDYIITTNSPQLTLSPFVLNQLPFNAGEAVTIYVRAVDQYQDPLLPTIPFESPWSEIGCEYTLPTNGGTDESGLYAIGMNNDIKFNVYPNPNSGDQVYLELVDFPDVDQNVIVTVTDMYGKTVHMEQFANSSNDLNKIVTFDQNLSSGMYLINLTINDQVVTKKLIVQ